MQSGKAIHKLKSPIDVATAKRLFALIYVDKNLSKKKRRTTRTIDEVAAAEDDSQILTESLLNPGKTSNRHRTDLSELQKCSEMVASV